MFKLVVVAIIISLTNCEKAKKSQSQPEISGPACDKKYEELLPKIGKEIQFAEFKDEALLKFRERTVRVKTNMETLRKDTELTRSTTQYCNIEYIQKNGIDIAKFGDDAEALINFLKPKLLKYSEENLLKNELNPCNYKLCQKIDCELSLREIDDLYQQSKKYPEIAKILEQEEIKPGYDHFVKILRNPDGTPTETLKKLDKLPKNCDLQSILM